MLQEENVVYLLIVCCDVGIHPINKQFICKNLNTGILSRFMAESSIMKRRSLKCKMLLNL